jgi:aspartate racemase
MKTIGLIGGMSYNSTVEYYRIINEEICEQMGGLHSAQCIIISLDFAKIVKLQEGGRWDKISKIIIPTAQKLEKIGADFIVLCSNTLHKLAQDIQENINIPFLNIVDCTGEIILKQGIKNIGLLGTKFIMEDTFYKNHLQNFFGIKSITPNPQERGFLHDIIFDELCIGRINRDSINKTKEIINSMILKGAQGVILGCTEIHALTEEFRINIPLFDSLLLHAHAAATMALE